MRKLFINTLFAIVRKYIISVEYYAALTNYNNMYRLGKRPKPYIDRLYKLRYRDMPFI